MIYELAFTVILKQGLMSEHGEKKTPGEFESEDVIEGTYRGYRYECYGCMPMRNQSHHHSEYHYRGNEREREREAGAQRWSELEMEHHTF